MIDLSSPPRIARLATQEPFGLSITWRDGGITRHDLSGMVASRTWAAALRDPAVFRTAQVQDDGWQVVWPGTDVALSAAGLWDDAHKPASASPYMSAADFAAWMRELDWSFAQASEALGISKRMLKYYAAGEHDIPKTVWLACMHLAAEHARNQPGEACDPALPLHPPRTSAISRPAGRPSRPR